MPGMNLNGKTRAAARASMWCNRMLVNGSTANFEHHYIAFMLPLSSSFL
jgi:hypothetical protein